MKILAFFDRINLDMVQGDCVLAREALEALADAGNEVHLIGHGTSEKVFVHSPAAFSHYTRTFTAPITGYFSLKKMNELAEKECFDVVLAKNLVFPRRENLWTTLPSPLTPSDSVYYRKMRVIFKEKALPFVFWIEGITVQNSFASFFAGQNREVHLTQLNACNGVVVLSNAQESLLREAGVKNRFFRFPASTDVKRFTGKRKKRKSGDWFRVLYLSSSVGLPELHPFLERLKQMPHVRLFVTSDETREQKNWLDSMNLSDRVEFIGRISPAERFNLVQEFDAGLYLKRFRQPIGDASTFMKVSEYMAASLPVIGPRMRGLEEQAGKGLICFEEKNPKELEKILLGRKSMERIGEQNQRKAGKEFDLKENAKKLAVFLEEVMQNG